MKSQKMPEGLHNSLAETFVELPSQVVDRLSQDQIEVLFPNKRVWREVVQKTLIQHNMQAIEGKGD